MKIKITEFGKRHFDKTFGGTKILDHSSEDFESFINNDDVISSLKAIEEKTPFNFSVHIYDGIEVYNGYAPFCKLVAIRNFTDARVGSLPITLENYQYLRSGYSSRTDDELPVFSRWLELPLGKPKAEWLILVLYSKEQIDAEEKVKSQKNNVDFVEFDADWGVVAILGQSHSKEEPMKPETMLRNALGKEEGGSGVPLDKEKYLKSVKFWSENATVK